MEHDKASFEQHVCGMNLHECADHWSCHAFPADLASSEADMSKCSCQSCVHEHPCLCLQSDEHMTHETIFKLISVKLFWSFNITDQHHRDQLRSNHRRPWVEDRRRHGAPGASQEAIGRRLVPSEGAPVASYVPSCGTPPQIVDPLLRRDWPWRSLFLCGLLSKIVRPHQNRDPGQRHDNRVGTGWIRP